MTDLRREMYYFCGAMLFTFAIGVLAGIFIDIELLR